MPKYNSRSTVLTCAMAILFGIRPATGAETVFTDDVRIQNNLSPRLFLDQTAGGGNLVQNWELVNNNAGNFLIYDFTNNKVSFRIEPNGPASSQVIKQNGHIGFGTDSPAANLHVMANDFLPALRLESTSDNPYTWELRGSSAGLDLVDVTNTNAFPFRIKPGAPTSSFLIDATGRIGLGTATPDPNSELSIFSSLLNGILMKRPDANPHYLRVENTGGIFRSGVQGNGDAQFGALTAGKGLNLLAGGASKVTVNSTGQISFGNAPPTITDKALVHASTARLAPGGIWTNASSRTLKQDIEPITSEQARETVRALQPVGYRYKNELDERYVGFIAEDVPELVATNDRKGLAPMDIVAVLTKVVQDQDKVNEQQQQTIARQQTLLTELTQRLKDLERRTGGGGTPSP